LAFETFDDELMIPLAQRAVDVARQTGMVSLFPIAGLDPRRHDGAHG
jgi:hypothetical protein